jgi:hypothetical protein
MVRYGVSRHVPATDKDGKAVELALVVVEHENGHLDKFAVREDLIRFAGVGIIENEVQIRAAGHSATQSNAAHLLHRGRR